MQGREGLRRHPTSRYHAHGGYHQGQEEKIFVRFHVLSF